MTHRWYLLLVLLVQAAFGELIRVDDNSDAPTYFHDLTNPMWWTFNLASLSEHGITSASDVVSARAYFLFADDGEEVYQTSVETSYELSSERSYTRDYGGCHYIYNYFYRTRTAIYTDELDEALVRTVNGERYGMISTPYSEYEDNGSRRDRLESREYWLNGQQCRQFDYYYTDLGRYTSGYSGDFQIGFGIFGDNLDRIVENGWAAFYVSRVAGDFYLRDAWMEFETAEAVPEPGIASLLVAGLLWIGVAAVRRRG